MKRVLALLLVMLLSVGCLACADKDADPELPIVPDTENGETAEPDASTEPDAPIEPDDGGEAEFAELNTNYWTLRYDDSVWTYEADDFYNEEEYSDVQMIIPAEEEGEYLVNAEISVNIVEPYGFRDMLTSYGFDQYEYEVDQAYPLMTIGGVGLLKQEGNYWGSPCLRYMNRVEGAKATVFIEIIGAYDDPRVQELLDGLTITLTDIGNEDGPWEWEGTPFAAEDASCLVGTTTLQAEWIPFAEAVTTNEVFEHAVAVVGDTAYILEDGALKQYTFDGEQLTFVADVALDDAYGYIYAAKDGSVWVGDFMNPLLNLKDGTVVASYDDVDHIAMDPSGSWGISYFTSAECEKFTVKDGALKKEPITFAEVDTVRAIQVDAQRIYVCGSDKNDSGHKVFIYDHDGNHLLTLADEDGSGLGSVTFVVKTASGYLAMDGNMRDVVLWLDDGTWVGSANDGDLFGTSYPWFCGGTVLEDGSVLLLMTEEREDRSADEVIAFRLSGF